MSQKECVGSHVEELNDIVVADNTTTSSLGKRLGRENPPVVVGVIVSIASDLLTLTTDTAVFILKGVLVRVRVEIDLGVLMTEGENIIVVDVYKGASSVGRH